MMSGAAREMNAVTAITFREIVLALKSPFMIGYNILFPMIFVGMLGGGMSQNLAGDLPFDFMQFVLIGMIVMIIFTGTITGISQLIEERNSNFTIDTIGGCLITNNLQATKGTTVEHEDHKFIVEEINGFQIRKDRIVSKNTFKQNF